jgi:diguanylate cyclase (GGDEF)-like protein
VRNRKYVLSLIAIVASMLLGITAFEVLKHIFQDRIADWESHVGTILFGSILAVVGSYLTSRRRLHLLEQLSQQVEDRERTNRELMIRTARLEERDREIKLLSQMSNFMQSCQSVSEASVVIAQTMKQLFPEDSGAVFTFRNSRNLLEAAAVWGNHPPTETAFAPDECWAIRLGRDHLFAGTPDAIALRCKHVGSPAEYVCMPMTVQGEVMGSLYLTAGAGDGKGSAERWSGEKQLILRNVTEQIGLVLWNIRLREDLRNLSIRDPLTGLFNRRFMEESLNREFVRARRDETPIGIIMLDIDHFKHVNDRFGHEAGDAVLREVGALLLKSVRGSDIACRYGGEEFALILPNASIEATSARAESVLEKMTQLKIVHADQALGPIGLSAGVAVFPGHGSTAEAVFSAADKALYQAKREGRDRVCVADPRPHQDEDMQMVG